MHRFFVPSAWLLKEKISLTGPLSHQLSRVLRLRPGAHITLLDDSGWAYEAELESVAPAQVVVRVIARSRPPTEPRVRLVLYQALLKGKKLDWIIQKGTELGVSVFVPLITQRCIVSSPDRFDEHRMARWRRIATEAAEQSGRTRLPQLLPVRPFAEACEPPLENAAALIACVSEQARPLGHVLHETVHTALEELRLLVGPEGGFTENEVRRARQAGIVPISLGTRILRTETASLAALTILLYALGELG